jgi:hypothetical protein
MATGDLLLGDPYVQPALGRKLFGQRNAASSRVMYTSARSSCVVSVGPRALISGVVGRSR